MNYYEELGLASSASLEEIRRAYKHLARLLHPDLCADEDLRRLAELQLKRLNHVVEVLSNPERRRLYDLGLGQPVAQTCSPAAFRRRPGYWVWLAAGVLSLAGLAWLFHHGSAEPVKLARPRPPAVGEPAPRPAPPPESRGAPERRPARVRESARAFELPTPPQLAPATDTLAAAPLALAPALPPPAPEPEAVRPPRYAGSWLYTRTGPPDRSLGLYPAEYVELLIADDGGLLRGRYRARYRIPDRLISPVVAFRFEGRPNGDGPAELAWEGAAGARGLIRLELLDPGSLKVTWSATEVGGMQLASGSALLVRFKEP